MATQHTVDKTPEEKESSVALSMEYTPGEFFDMGRPPLEYNTETGDAICMLVALGWSLRRIKAEGEKATGQYIPALSTVFKWMRENEDFSKQYARAKDEQMEYFSEEMLDISDDGRNDWVEVWDRDGKNVIGYKVNGEAVMRSKLRVDLRKWLMSKRLPKKYGDKLDLTSGGDRIKQAPLIVSQIGVPKQEDEDATTETETEAGS